jgi:hypothetical protein
MHRNLARAYDYLRRSTIESGPHTSKSSLEADLGRAWSRDPLVLSQGGVHERYTEEDDPVTHPVSTRNNGARGGSRTPRRY